MISVEIHLKDKQIQYQDHYLKLREDNWPVKKMDKENFTKEEISIYDNIMGTTFKWRELSTIIKTTGLSREVVKKSLKKLQDENLVRKDFLKSIDNQELYGVTLKVGISPE